MTELNLWLDNYDDIYSDFDSRHYLKRRVSDDFLHELRIAFRHKEGPADNLVLLLPKERRKETSEKMIAESLEDYFQKQYAVNNDHSRRKLWRGIMLFIAGILLMIINTFISYSVADTFPAAAIKVVIEPAGWFLVWAAMDFLFYDLKDLRKERNFYRELAEANVHFRSA